MLLGALLPSIDFDVKEYHLQGPKEWYLAGQITFLEHNVYTSFPFLTEMLSLSGMLIFDDWFWGALVGKTVLMTFAPSQPPHILSRRTVVFGTCCLVVGDHFSDNAVGLSSLHHRLHRRGLDVLCRGDSAGI